VNVTVQTFYNQTLNLTKLNYASIILISKLTENNTIEQYRPISLINYSVKIITKVLANRMITVIDTIIDKSQITFISGRNIHNNIICAQKILF
jgi:Reverse transcriptase (RNA-dependent DNA polymerase)